MAEFLKFALFLFLTGFSLFHGSISADSGSDENRMKLEHSTNDFVFWPNATIPFYIDREHYDEEQSLSIMTSLSLFTFKTCLKFAPVPTRPGDSHHVLLFENPKGVRKCTINTDGHSIDEPHKLVLGYECLKSPDIEMMIMNALGFPFEHNRAIRDLYIDVQQENVEPGYIELFTIESKLPMELRLLPYDLNSVMHFDERAFSKNGHRTIIFKDHKTKQNRDGLSDIDLRKIEIIYGPECLKRDRQEKIELCQYYPGVARKKREVELPDPTTNLRVNRNITPPSSPATTPEGSEAPKNQLSDELNQSLKDLGIENEVQEIVDQVNKVSGLALQNARTKYCNETKADLRAADEKKPIDILGIVESVAEYAQIMVANAMSNLTLFCEVSKSLSAYQRQKATCPFFNPDRCPKNYRSTKSGPVKHSTQHRPQIRQSTKHQGSYNAAKGQYDSQYSMRAHEDNSTNVTAEASRRKREAESIPLQDKNPEEEFYRRKRLVNTQDNIIEAVEEVNRWKREVETKDPVITTVTVSLPSTEASSLAAETTPDTTPEPTTTDIPDTTPEVPHSEATETQETTTVFSETKAPNAPKGTGDEKTEFPPKPDLRMRNTPTPLPKKIEYAPDDRRRAPLRQFRRKSLRVKAKKREKEEWDNSRMSLERQKLKEAKIIREVVNGEESEEEESNDVNKGNDDDYVKVHKKKIASSSEEKKAKTKESVLEFVPETVTLSKKNREFYRDRRWPDNEVPYIIKEDGTFNVDDVRQRLREVNEILKDKTCVQIKEIRESQANKYEDLLVLDSSPDYVTGRVGGRQIFGVVELLRGGQHRQHAAMIVMAMLGFYFEVSRHDRDKYIRVHQRHVRADKLHHFEKIRSDATFDLPYDYDSATHPAWQFWRHIGRTGISTVATFKEQDPDGHIMKTLGQHEQLLSNIDLIKINSVYGVKCFKSARRAKLKKKAPRRF